MLSGKGAEGGCVEHTRIAEYQAVVLGWEGGTKENIPGTGYILYGVDRHRTEGKVNSGINPLGNFMEL